MKNLTMDITFSWTTGNKEMICKACISEAEWSILTNSNKEIEENIVPLLNNLCKTFTADKNVGN
jgi:hypothetical protein